MDGVYGVKSSGVGLITGLMGYYGGNPVVKYCYGEVFNSKPLIGRKDSGTSSQGNETVSDGVMTTWTQEDITTKLTDNFVKDEYNINDGYPILKWQIEE